MYESWHRYATPSDERRAFFGSAEDIMDPTEEAFVLYRDKAKNLNQKLEIVQQSHKVKACHEKLKSVIDALQNPGAVQNKAFVLSLEKRGIKLDPATPPSRLADFLQSQKIVMAAESARATEQLQKAMERYEVEWGEAP